MEASVFSRVTCIMMVQAKEKFCKGRYPGNYDDEEAVCTRKVCIPFSLLLGLLLNPEHLACC